MKWKLLSPDELINFRPRHGHRAVAINDGIIIYGGGNNMIYKELHYYDVAQNSIILPMYSGRMQGIAGYGVTVYQKDKLIFFGGMKEYWNLSNQLNQLDVNKWHWSKISQVSGSLPAPRFGHSFTLVDENRIFMFGGITNRNNTNYEFNPCYMNDLYILHTYGKTKFGWEMIKTELAPSPRDSHSAVLHPNKNFLIIFGGCNGERLGDLWFLDVTYLKWQNVEVTGIPPTPRSLHTANILGSQMLVFGGWEKDKNSQDGLSFFSSNILSSLDLDKMEWRTIEVEGKLPKARAGHSAVVTHDRLYIFSGRHDYQSSSCLDNSWYLETSIPRKIDKISLICSSTSTLEILWEKIPNANCYLIEVKRVAEFKINIPIKLVANQIQEKRKGDTPTSQPLPKRVIIFKPNIEQMDGCDDKNIETERKTRIANVNVSKTDFEWCTVGIHKSNHIKVDGLFAFTFVKEKLNDEICPQTIKMPKIALKNNSIYAFRIYGLNACGVGEVGKIAAYRTMPEGLPTPPKNCKFIRTATGLRLAWNPQPMEEKVSEYRVHIAENQGSNFIQVYEGKQPTCEVSNEYINNTSHHMYIKNDPNRYFFFRIAAKNDKGFGPFANIKVIIEGHN